jgi:hypothetical protein
MVILIKENDREVYNDSLGLSIWWSLSILRDTLTGCG